MSLAVVQHRFFLITFALIAFAGNSVLCRLALQTPDIDPVSFSVIRLFSGALFLSLLVLLNQSHKIALKVQHTLPALALTVYAFCFSWAYMSVETGTGALILFATVQLAMIGFNLIKGYTPRWIELSGIAFALLGLTVLVYPALDSPSLYGFIIMALSGVAWAAYTIFGKSSKAPTLDTAHNFLMTLPFCGLILLANLDSLSLTNQGIYLAVASGALASGAGYAVWYSALRHISVLQAGVLQLSVPLIAALGGILWAGEVLNLQFVIASALILTGIYLILVKPRT